MSSTKRGGQRSPADNYETPGWCVRRLLEKCDLPGGVWLEPCAGTGKIIREVNSLRSDVFWIANELRPECLDPLSESCETSGVGSCLTIGDFLTTCEHVFAKRRPDVLLTNPPFSLSSEFVEVSIDRVEVLAILQRLNYIGSEERSSFMREFPPDVYVLPNRPMFTRNKKGKMSSDSIEYAWFVWAGRVRRAYGRFMVLNSTPKSERITK